MYFFSAFFISNLIACVVCISKRGILLPWNSDPADFSQFSSQNCPKASFYNSWESWPHPNIPNNLQFIAMARTLADIEKLYKFMPSNKASWLIFLNEPDLPGSTQLDVNSAIGAWRQHALHFRYTQGTKLIAPAITSDKSKGLPWLRSFINGIGDCRPDALAVHYYGTSGNDFKNYVQSIYNEFHLPIFVHEVASTDKYMASVVGFMEDINRWADQQAWILGIFWFCASRDANIEKEMPLSSLLDFNGHRTDLAYRFCYN